MELEPLAFVDSDDARDSDERILDSRASPEWRRTGGDDSRRSSGGSYRMSHRHGQGHRHAPQSGPGRPARLAWRAAKYIFWLIVLILLLLNLAIESLNYKKLSSNQKEYIKLDPQGSLRESLSSSASPRNLIFMVTDGMGPSHLTFAREFQRQMGTSSGKFSSKSSQGTQSFLPQDSFLVGTSQTKSTSSAVTDSAAGATAFSCGLRTNNGQVGTISGTDTPCGSVFEAAKEQRKFRVGTVSTSRVTHATPAAFTSHVQSRDEEVRIAFQQVHKGRVDLLLGGGKAKFTKAMEEKKGKTRRNRFIAGGLFERIARRKDEEKATTKKTALEKAKNSGFKYIETREQLLKLTSATGGSGNSAFPILGLFANDHLDYEIDRHNSTAPGGGIQPSLAEMTETALRLMSTPSSDTKDGKAEPFMLMVEGSRIDMAAHANDPAALAHEILAFQEAFTIVVDFVKKHPDTLVISTSDHDTGGLSLGWQPDKYVYPEYRWFPSCFSTRNFSAESLRMRTIDPFCASLKGFGKNKANDDSVLNDFINNKLLGSAIPVPDGLNDGASETIVADIRHTLEQYCTKKTKNLILEASLSRVGLGLCSIDFATQGHTGVDVNLYTFGAEGQKSKLRGSVRNYEIGKYIEDVFGLDLNAQSLRSQALLNEWDKTS
eukprot:Nk52_evm6s2596 gene=Nk52_evmTU6s2596